MLYNRHTGIYKFGINIYPRRIRPRSNLSDFFGKKVRHMGREIRYIIYPKQIFIVTLIGKLFVVVFFVLVRQEHGLRDDV